MRNGTFRCREFTIGDYTETYEELMQEILVDRPRDFRLVSRNSTWTKDGDHIIFVEYIEYEPESF